METVKFTQICADDKTIYGLDPFGDVYFRANHTIKRKFNPGTDDPDDEDKNGEVSVREYGWKKMSMNIIFEK